MPDAGELLRDAQFAFQNIGQGSTANDKYVADAKSLARRLIKTYPNSREVAAAQSILEQLEEGARSPKAGIQLEYSTASKDQQRLKFQEAASSVVESDNFAGGRPESKLDEYLLPGWPRRLMQAIPVVIGVIVVLRGLDSLSFSLSRTDIQSLLMLVAGVFLVVLPGLQVFARFLAFAKTKVLVGKDWSADVKHMPTRQDIRELASAFVDGNFKKRLVILVVLFALSGFAILFAAVVYVVGARKTFDDVESWLLGRMPLASNVNAVTPDNGMRFEGRQEPTMKPDDAGKEGNEATVRGSVAEIVVTVIGLAIFALVIYFVAVFGIAIISFAIVFGPVAAIMFFGGLLFSGSR